MRTILSLAFFSTTLMLSPCEAQRASQRQPMEFWAFTGPWDPQSAVSTRRHGHALDAIITGWIALDSTSGRPIIPSLYPDTTRPEKGTPPRMAIITSWHGDRFHARTIRMLAANGTRLGEVARAIALHAARSGYRGLVLDFEDLSSRDLNAQLRVVAAITDSARARGISPVVVAIPAGDTAAYPARKLLTVADLVLVMLYDQHWSGSAPGPISEPSWVQRSLAIRVAEAGAARIVAGLPTYGYRWRAGQPGEGISFGEARREAQAAGTELQRDRASQTLRAARAGSWDIWVTDAQLLRTLLDEVARSGVRKVSLWRLGQEDPALWEGVVH
jgi:spore germination protein YaaH